VRPHSASCEAIRSLIERGTLTPGAKRGEVNIMLHGEFGAILQWLGADGSRKNDDSPAAYATGLGVSSKLVAGTGPFPVTLAHYEADITRYF